MGTVISDQDLDQPRNFSANDAHFLMTRLGTGIPLAEIQQM